MILKIIQYRGPFTRGDFIEIRAEYDTQYVHIGIQIPYRQPIAYLPENTGPDADLEMGEYDSGRIAYRVNERGILEFDEIVQNSWMIRFLKDMPVETIIDIMYDETQDI